MLLQNARATYGLEAMSRVGLDHIVLVRSIDPNPFHGSHPFHGAHPFHGTPPAAAARAPTAVSSYGVPGSGGRQPMTYVGPQPVRRTDDEIVGRRPVVATLDTGCGKHPWLVGVVKPGPGLDGQPIGYVDDPTDPRSGSTRSVPSTAASTRSPATARSSPA